MPKTTLDELRRMMGRGEWNEAILAAAALPHLPERGRDRILSAREAIRRPDFQKELGRSIEGLIEAGKQALIDCYARKSS